MQKLTASLSAQTVIKLPKKSTRRSRTCSSDRKPRRKSAKQYPIEDQHIAKYLTQIGNRLVAAAPTELNSLAR